MTKTMKIMATGAAVPALLALGMQVAGANPVTANYNFAPNASIGFEDIVGPFDTYDLANGVALVESVTGSLFAPSVGDTSKTYFQAHLQAHQLGANTVSSPGLGLGTYEITVVADFQDIVTSVSAFGVSTMVTGGTAKLYFDTTPDKNYILDSGFADQDILITGNITGGIGSLSPSLGVGFEAITVQVTSFDSNVFTPSIFGANGIFTLDIRSSSINGVTSVQGHTFNAGADILIGADGNLQLSAVPVPAAVWMLGSALVGMVTIRRRPQG